MSRFGVKQLLAYAIPKLNYQTDIILVGKIYNFTLIRYSNGSFMIRRTRVLIGKQNIIYAEAGLHIIVEFRWAFRQPALDSIEIRIGGYRRTIWSGSDTMLAKYVTRNWTYKMVFDCLRELYDFKFE
jgi:hypothetical protein